MKITGDGKTPYSSDIGIRRIEIMMDENAPAINGKRVKVEVIEEAREK